jgi:putative salt-induced outer membrane protein YdiY
MRVLMALIVTGMMSVALADDEVKLKNGDRLTGKITGMAGGKLTIDTSHSGKVIVDWVQVVAVKTDEPIKLKLATGEWLEGKVSAGAEGKIKVDSAGAAAPVEVEYPKIKSINEAPAAWHGKLSAAAKAADGNTNSASFLISGEATRETDADLLFAKAIFRYGESEGVLDERNSYGIAKYQYKLGPTLYLYVSQELSSDTFKDLSLNSTTSAGVGNTWFKEKAIDLSSELGIAYMSNNHNVDPDESHLGARIALYLRVTLPLGFELKDNFTFYPNFETSQDFQLRNEATLGTSLGAGWDLLGGVITEYDKTPSTGRERRDDTYFVGLGYTF